MRIPSLPDTHVPFSVASTTTAIILSAVSVALGWWVAMLRKARKEAAAEILQARADARAEMVAENERMRQDYTRQIEQITHSFELRLQQQRADFDRQRAEDRADAAQREADIHKHMAAEIANLKVEVQSLQTELTAYRHQRTIAASLLMQASNILTMDPANGKGLELVRQAHDIVVGGTVEAGVRTDETMS